LSVLLSILSFVWFITSNVLIYSSLNSCRLAAPHMWWLTFSILTLTYLMLLELFFLGLIVFVIGPIVYVGFMGGLLFLYAYPRFSQLVWNVFLMCIGQHPLQNPHSIKPEIGKLSKAAVDKIPLVLYIPAPEEQEPGPIPKPSPAHTYPPTPPKPKPPKRRFFFLRKKKSGDSGSKEKGKAHCGSGSGDSWEDNWEKGEYPFVRLEGNRAACAICLMDFDEPKRAGENSGKDTKDKGAETKGVENEVSQPHEGLTLEDAGEGPQPLRLLACGHVFHVSEAPAVFRSLLTSVLSFQKTCLDPWLTGVSGRCPVCQRPVETQDTGAEKRRNART
jgi:hypothetical protein